MANIYIRSLFWLLGFGTLGYSLIQFTPDKRGTSDEIFGSKFNLNVNEEQKTKTQILEKLKEASKSKPIYLEKFEK